MARKGDSQLSGREREVQALVEQGLDNTAIGRALGVSRDCVRRYLATDSIGRPAPPDRLSDRVEDPQEIPVIVRDYSHLDSMYLYPLGDVHLGARTHQAKRWREWISYLVNTPGTSMLGTGDFLNSAIIGAKSDVYDEVLSVGDAKRQLRGELTPLAREGRLDLLMPGNHEDRITRAVGDCPILDVAEWLDAPYAKAAAWMVYRVGDVEYDIYVRHGTGSGQSLIGLTKSGMVAQADAYVTGHTHRIATTADEIFVREGGKVRRKRRYYVSSGSWLGYESYAAQRGYSPARIGAPRIYLDGRRKDLHCSI